MSQTRVQVVVESPLVRVSDVCCRLPRSPAGGEEYVASTRFVFPRRGVFAWHTRNTSIVGDANTALVFTGGEGYRVSHPADGGDDCTVVAFAPALLHEALSTLPDHLILPAPLQRGTRLLLYALHASRGDPLVADDVAIELLDRLLPEIERQGGSSAPETARRDTRRERDAVEALRALIAGHPGASLSLDALAREVHWSPFHLARRFRAITGTPVHQYRLRIRYALALELLAQGCDDLSRLAADLGFASHSHFSAGFKRSYGMTPEQARAALRHGGAGELRKILIA